MKQAAATLKLDMAAYWDLQAFAQFASDLDRATQAQLGRGVRTVEVLKQDKNAPMELADQIAIIYTATNGYLDDLPVEKVKPFEQGLLPFLRDRYGDVIHAINSTRQITPETEFKLKQGIEEFKTHFVQQ
jgi:F-type H+-transporting ATPase subunit alpha